MNHLDGIVRDDGATFGAPAPQAAPLAIWRQAFTEPQGAFLDHLHACYGDNDARLARRCMLWLSALDRFAAAFGQEGKVYLIGVPSRINWEGHHVDHQGGSYNATTDEREIVAVVRGRSDRKVSIVNVAADKFPAVEFSINGDIAKTGKGEWDNFVRGTLLALQRHFGGEAFVGMDMAVGSDIPIGAGLSSSHALVLASALGALAVNGKQLDKRQAVVLVQEGEWFVGSRTGLGDQATMVFGKRDRIFSSPVIEPDEINPRYVALPANHSCVLIHSFTQHKLAGAEGLGYNARVFAYKAAYPLVLSALGDLDAPRQALGTTRRLADINPERFSTALIYRALAALPDGITLAEAEQRFIHAVGRFAQWGAAAPKADFAELVKTYFGDGPRPSTISVKGVALYGLAECWRSRRYPELLEKGDLKQAGQLVYIGHDGDRVMRRDGHGGYVPVSNQVTNQNLLTLAADVESGDRARMEAAALESQSGDYRASVLELDQIVDVCRDVQAVSASLTGGGLGGVVTAMLRTDRLPLLKACVYELYAAQEEREIHHLGSAYASGTIDKNVLSAAQSLHEVKIQARAAGRTFTADPSLLAAIEPARSLRNKTGQSLVRLLPVDYIREGFVENSSIAGAGYLNPQGA
jgi:galactokinase